MSDEDKTDFGLEAIREKLKIRAAMPSFPERRRNKTKA